MTDQNADRDSWRIRAEAAEALVRQMRVEVDDLGIQYHAAQERLRLADGVIKRMAAGIHYIDWIDDADLALAEWRAVPGDAKVSP